MAGLGKSHRNAIDRVLRNRSPRVDFTAIWQEIYRNFGIGSLEGSKLRFAPGDFALLLAEARREFGGDPRESLHGLDRIQAASHSIDEKQAPQRPDDGFVLVKGALPSPLPALAPGLSLRVPLPQLDLAAVEQVLVIENLDSFDAWERYEAPAELDNSLILYRGHRGWARGTRQLLASLPPSASITVFPDYDPAGLSIAVSLPRADALLLPELEQSLLAKGSREHFLRQSRQTVHLDGLDLGGWRAVWDEMKGHQLSIKQQHMLALGTSLRLRARY